MKDNCIWQPGSIHGDEYYTRQDVAEQICSRLVNYHLKVWLPFNDRQSVWGGVLSKTGHEVAYTDGNFFDEIPPDGANCIISNPPFSIKKEILERTKQLGLPFAYILPFTWLNDSIPLEYGNQLLFFRKRMHFNEPSGKLNKPRCNCFVLSNGLLRSNLDVVWK